MAKVTMPQLGESVAEGTIGKWLKQPGDHVAKYEPLVEVVTDKVNAEVPSPFEGVLREILAEEGSVVPNNAEIAVIETADDGAGEATSEAGGPVTESKPPAESKAAASTAADAAPPREPAAAPEPQPAVATGPAGSDERSPSVTAAAASASSPTATGTAAPVAAGDPDARMTPAVRRLLREHDLSPAQISGTGGGGRITRDDVLKVVESIRTGAAPVVATASAGNGPRPCPSRLRQAPPRRRPRRQPRARTAAARRPRRPVPRRRRRGPRPDDPDAQGHRRPDDSRAGRARTPTSRWRSTRRTWWPSAKAPSGDYQAREGIALSYVPFVVKAVAEALKRNPTFNALWTDAGLLAKRRVNIGVAVAVDEGLIVPVVRDVGHAFDQRSQQRDRRRRRPCPCSASSGR